MALTMRRLFLAGRAFRPRSGGSCGPICDHCSSDSSKRLFILDMEQISAWMEKLLATLKTRPSHFASSVTV